ncbi:MAG: TolC family protein [Bryobacteraceae bacterium]
MRAILAILTVGLASGQPVLSLREALDRAAKQNPAIQIAQLKTLEAEFAVTRTRSAYQPQMNVVVGSAYQTSNLQGIGLVFPGFPSRIGPYRTFNARPVLTQTVLDLSLLTEVRAAQERTRQFRHEADAAREAILYATLEVYLRALEADSRLAAAEARVKTAEAVRKQAADRQSAGAASMLDLERSNQQLEDERVGAENARRDAEVLRAVLVRTIGAEGTVTALEPLEPRPTLLDYDAAVASAQQNRPEVKALESAIRAASLDRLAAERQRLPRISASADYGLLGAGPDRSIGTYAVGASLTIPVWTSKRIESEAAMAAVKAKQLHQQLRDMQLEIAREVRQAHIEAQSAERARKASAESVRAAREVLELARLRFSSGLATTLDTVVAQGNLAQSEDQQIRARYDQLLARARLAHARGDVFTFFE